MYTKREGEESLLCIQSREVYIERDETHVREGFRLFLLTLELKYQTERCLLDTKTSR